MLQALCGSVQVLTHWFKGWEEFLLGYVLLCQLLVSNKHGHLAHLHQENTTPSRKNWICNEHSSFKVSIFTDLLTLLNLHLWFQMFSGSLSLDAASSLFGLKLYCPLYFQQDTSSVIISRKEGIIKFQLLNLSSTIPGNGFHEKVYCNHPKAAHICLFHFPQPPSFSPHTL